MSPVQYRVHLRLAREQPLRTPRAQLPLLPTLKWFGRCRTAGDQRSRETTLVLPDSP